MHRKHEITKPHETQIQAVIDKLNELRPITLKEMDDVVLMDRIDTKYIFHISKLPDILDILSPQYRVLDINNNRAHRLESLYYDTEKYDFFHTHLNGRVNRYKVRYRRYADSDQHYFEIKYKNNKQRTIKSRIKQKSIDTVIKDEAAAFLKKKTPYFSEHLNPNILVCYSRITLVNNNMRERQTIDINLHFKYNNQVIYQSDLVIAELKQNKLASSFFSDLMRKKHIIQTPMSKYCLGMVCMVDHLKKNNFKPLLRSINKICHEQI